MAPLKQLNKQTTIADRGLKGRSQQVLMKKEVYPKRKAEESPLKRITVKRCAFGDVSNINTKENEKAELHGKATIVKKASVVSTRETRSRSSSGARKPLTSVNSLKPPIPPAKKAQVKDVPKTETHKQKVLKEQTNTINNSNHMTIPQTKKPQLKELPKSEPNKQKVLKEQTNTINKQSVTIKTTAVINVLPKPGKTQVKIIKKQGETTSKVTFKTRISDAADKSDSSLYVSALEELNLDDGVKDKCDKQLPLKKKQRKPPPLGIEDFDKENISDLTSVSIYAMDIFEYLKSRESHFKISDYMYRQPDINANMRALVVNWMVEVQENFEFNHETLYLAVKLFDFYLSKVRVTKSNLQLIACASLFVASKYDERFPPTIDDMLYVCDGLYSSEELTSLEASLLKTVDFQLGIPLSYRFLRRYARCEKLQMPILTLARYILESSLLDYSTIRYSDSKLASAALHLALLMSGKKAWTSSLEYYSGYKVDEFKDIVKVLNDVLHKKLVKENEVVKVKYSHKLFFEVAKIPLLSNSQL